MRNSLRLSVLMSLIMVASCGGSSGGSSAPPSEPTSNLPPTVNAGQDQTVDEGTEVSLSGTAQDSDGSIQSYSWEQNSGLAVTIADANTANASFTAPFVDASEVLQFQLTVTDDDGATASDNISITVNDVPLANNSPSISITSPADGETFDSNTRITLHGLATDTEDGTLSSNIAWTSDIDGDLGVGSPLVRGLTVGSHVVTASIEDSGGIRTTDSVSITVSPEFTASFTFPGGSIFGHLPVPQTNGFDYYFTPALLDASIIGDRVNINSVEVSAFGQNDGDVVNFDWEVHIGPAPFGFPEGQFIQTLVDPISGYDRTAPTQFRFSIGSQADTQSYVFSGRHNFVSGLSSASPYLSVVHAAITSEVTLTDGLYAQVFLWTADNRNSKISFAEITLTIQGEELPPIPGSAKRGGVWTGQATNDGLPGVTQEIVGITTDAGEFRFVSVDTLGQFIGTFNTSGNAAAGTGVGFAPAGTTWIDGSTLTSLTISGSMAERSSIQASWASGSSESGSISLVYDPIHDRNSALRLLSGSWTSVTVGYSIVLNVDEVGTFSGSDTNGCTYTGSATLIDENHNSYDINLDIAGCSSWEGAYSGLAVLGDNQSQNDTLFIAVDNGFNALSAELTR